MEFNLEFKRKRRAFKNMSDEELLEFIRINHKGTKLSEFKNKEKTAYKLIRDKKLLDLLTEEQTLIRQNIKFGSLRNLSDNELIEYFSKNCRGMRLGELGEKKQASAYNEARKRKLINRLVEEGILKRKSRRIYFSKMSDEEITDYVKKNYYGKNICKLKERDAMAYTECRKRGLIDKFEGQGILIRQIKKSGFFSKMSDEDLIKYFVNNHSSKPSSEVEKEESSAYNEARKRKLINRLVEEGILKRSMMRRWGTDNKIIDYVTNNYKGKSISSLCRDDPSLYGTLIVRGLIDRLVESKILLRLQAKNFKANKNQFLSSLKQDKTLQTLVIAHENLHGFEGDIEQTILNIFEGKFGDVRQIYRLLEESRPEIESLISEGVTNLGSYLGQYSLGDRKIAPILLGEIIMNLPENKVIGDLEDRLVRMLRYDYSLRFNENPEGILSEIEIKINQNEGKRKEIYQRLYGYYQDVLEIGEELNN